MPTFSYTAASASATIEAPDRASAVRSLMARGVAPTRLEEVRSRPTGRGGMALFGSGTMSLPETAAFVRELGTALSAGLPLVPALRTLARVRRTPAQTRMLAHLLDKVEHGATLADAMRTWGRPFDELLVNLVRAGEASGRLPDVLTQAAELLDRSLAMRRAITGALVYPAFLFVLVLIAVVVLVTFIMPMVLKTIEGTGVKLPWSTLALKALADFVGAYWWLLGLAGAGLVVLWQRLRSRPSSRYTMDKLALKLPLVGPMLTEAAVARLTRTLSTLVRAGLPVLQGLRLTSATITNSALRRSLADVAEQVSTGKTIADPMEKSGYFPPLLVQIVSLGERSGKLPELLAQAAHALEERTAVRVRVFTEALKPILILIVAGVVGFVIASILFALLAIQDSLQ